MSVQVISKLLKPSNKTLSDTKSAEYLDTHFKLLDDLDGLDDKYSSLKAKQIAASEQFSHSQKELERFISQTKSSLERYLTTSQELSLLRHSLTDELAFLNEELLSSLYSQDQQPSLLEDVETHHRNLKELESTRSYALIIHQALTLCDASAQQISAFQSPCLVSAESITHYTELHDFVNKVESLCTPIEQSSGEEGLNLLIFLRNIRDKTWGHIKQTFFSFLLSTIEPLGWPSSIDFSTASGTLRQDFEHAFKNLLLLQDLYPGSQCVKLDSLYPLQALVQPIFLRFKYHFEGTRQTNRADKPEWYFTHILNVVHEHRNLMEGPLQRLLGSTKHKEVDAQHQFTTLLFPLLHRKLRKTIPNILSYPPLLAHTIYQALSFDAALKQDGFQSIQSDQPVESASDLILGNTEWFNSWLDGEKKFSDDQYNEIINASSAWVLADVESDKASGHSDTRVTNSARRVKGLLEQITDRYTLLPKPLHRTKFLISIQLPILEGYESRITSSLDAFESLSLAFVRAVPGALTVGFGGKEEGGVSVDTRKLTAGVEGVQRLCKALLSAHYLQKALASWGEDMFFLELWMDMNQDPSLREIATQNKALPNPTLAPSDPPRGTIFEELNQRYANVANRARDMITQQITGEIEQRLKSHFAVTTLPDPNVETHHGAIAPTLLNPVALLSSHLNFLKNTLTPLAVISLYRTITSRLSEHILQRQILYRGRITVLEGQHILSECDLWLEACLTALGSVVGGKLARIESPWARFIQASRIISSEGDEWAAIISATQGGQDDQVWEETMVKLVGSCELSREEVSQVIKRRN